MALVTPSNASSSVRTALLDLLRSPDDGGTLSGWDGTADSGALTSPHGRAYPIVDGIPCLLPEGDDSHEFAEKRREMTARDEQAEAYDQMLGLKLFSIPEIPLTLRYLALEPDHVLLEGGCGTGRMTAAFAERVRAMVCLDFSLESLKAARAKLPPHLAAKVLFIQGDLTHLPLAADAFDRVGSFQVLEHLPTPDARAKAVAELSRVLAPRVRGGRLALSAYRWGPPVSWLSAKSGHHDGGIPFFRFTADELATLVRSHLSIKQRTGALLYHYLIWGRRHI